MRLQDGLPCDGIWEPFWGTTRGEFGAKKAEKDWLRSDVVWGKFGDVGQKWDQKRKSETAPKIAPKESRRQNCNILCPKHSPNLLPSRQQRFLLRKKEMFVEKKLRTDLFWHHQKVHQFCTPKKVSFGANPFRVRSARYACWRTDKIRDRMTGFQDARLQDTIRLDRLRGEYCCCHEQYEG